MSRENARGNPNGNLLKRQDFANIAEGPRLRIFLHIFHVLGTTLLIGHY